MAQRIQNCMVWLAAAMAAAGVLAAARGEQAAAVDSAYFVREVQPILEKRCLGCHGVGARLSSLDLRTRDAALKGGIKGPAVVPGNLKKSNLYLMAAGIRTPVMPPTGKISAREIETLRRWVQGGAPYGDSAVKNATKIAWWSFRAPVEPPVPAVKSMAGFNARAWVRTPIDAFVLQKLQQAGLRPNPPAGRRTLIRRAYLDLLGLPPTPEEVEAFVRDRSPNAWEKVVDRLLDSPHYGERWARHWLDVVRYADSSGFEGDKDRPLMWRYRDYIIRSFNEDKPYDRFIREQLAGDEMVDEGKSGRVNAAADSHSPSHAQERDAVIATAYLGGGMEDFAQVKDAKARADEVDDLISTTGSAFLGLTVMCARCHDHKYDPITTRDYYRLYAVFAPTERKEIPIPTEKERRLVDAHNAEIEREMAPLRERQRPLREKAVELGRPVGKSKLTDDEIGGILKGADKDLFWDLQGKIKQVEARRQDYPKAFGVTDKGPHFEQSYLLIRGDAYHKGDPVDPGFIAMLPGGNRTIPASASLETSTGRRTALAGWIATAQNPLTARVWVNRVWMHHFGRGIVNSPSNFGISGEQPTHPELLDWLASRFTAPAEATFENAMAPLPPNSGGLVPLPLASLPPNTGGSKAGVRTSGRIGSGRWAARTAVQTPFSTQGVRRHRITALVRPGPGGRGAKIANCKLQIANLRLPPVHSPPELGGRGANGRQANPAESGGRGAGRWRASSASQIVNRKSKIEYGFGWRLKPLQRMILLSSAWQQSSAVRPEAAAKDPQNLLIWRMPVQRLEAEAVRDSILAAAGTLNHRMYGPPVYPPVDPVLRADTFQGYNWPEGVDNASTWRRSIYIKVKRSLLFPLLEVFDCPEITYSVARRNITTSPTQALALLNDPLILRQAALFAERLRRECGPNPTAQVDRAYRLTVCRPPTARERSASLAFLSHRSLEDFCHALFNLNELVYVP